MSLTEQPVTFACGDATLIGMVHHGDPTATIGIVFVVPEGPQFRGGVCRNLVLSARQLAKAGIPSLRFDQRGVGDSGGAFLGFERCREDIAAAVAELRRCCPQLTGVVLWGECSGASAAAMDAWTLKDIRGLVLQNPWIRSESTQADALIKHHYKNRLRQWSFWKKVLTLQFSPVASLKSFLELRRQRKGSRAVRAPQGNDTAQPFKERMRLGLKQLNAPVLIFQSDRAIPSREFDSLLAMEPVWAQTMDALPVRRVYLDPGTHAFESRKLRKDLVDAALSWLRDLD